MDMRSEIKKLARIEDGQYPFLSLYLNTKWDDEQQRERISWREVPSVQISQYRPFYRESLRSLHPM